MYPPQKNRSLSPAQLRALLDQEQARLAKLGLSPLSLVAGGDSLGHTPRYHRMQRHFWREMQRVQSRVASPLKELE